MLRRLGRFLLFHLNPDASSGAVRPASITYCSTRATEAVAANEQRAFPDAGEATESRSLDVSYVPSAGGAGFGSGFAALWAGIAGTFLDVGRAADRKRVTAALERLDSSDREILAFSLRRWVADDPDGSLRGRRVPDFARRPAAVVERLLGDLGVERDEDLGCVLEALLDPKTWVGLGRAGRSVAGRPLRLEAPARLLAAPHPVTPGPGEAPIASAGKNGPGEREEGAARRGTSLEPRPVPRTELVPLSRPRGGWVRAHLARNRIAAVGVVAAVVLATAGLVSAAGFGGREQRSGRKVDGSSTRGPFLPRRVAPVGAPFPSEPSGATRYPTAYIRRATVLYDRPGGRPRVKVPSRTEWGSPRVLSVVGQHGSWLGVLAPELKNDRVGWLAADRARIETVSYALHADLSRRELTVSDGSRTVRRVPVAIGAPSTPTPTGRFAVTDKLDVSDRSSSYGCCVLVLTAHQTKLPPDWPGGDRLAVHSTRNVKAIGHPVSLGCLRATFRHARWLMKTIPLGAPVFIRR